MLATNGHIYMIPYHAHSIGDFDPSTGVFSAIDISDRFNSHEGKYAGGVLGPDGYVYMVPHIANSLFRMRDSNQEAAYTVAGGVPVTWGPLLSPHFNKF